MSFQRSLLLLGLLLLLDPIHARAQARLVGLGSVPNGGLVTEAQDVSADGSVVVGRGLGEPGAGYRAIRWSEASGAVDLGLTGTLGSSRAYGVSADGSVVVGRSHNDAAIWEDGGSLAIPPRTASGFARANDVSANGAITVGKDDSGWFLYWENVGLLRAGASTGEARAVSADGAVVVGTGGGLGSLSAFRWTLTDGVQNLGVLPGAASSFSSAEGISPDGRVIVGYSGSSVGQQAFRWTAETGMLVLGNRETGTNYMQHALDASFDGSLLVGTGISETRSGFSAMIWDEANGVRSLEVVLAAAGVDLEGWNLAAATAVSYDGKTIVGYGTNPDGQAEGWYAVIPEPGTTLLLAIGLGLLATRRDQRSSQRSEVLRELLRIPGHAD